MLLEQVWDYHFDPGTNVIDVHVSRLRRKLDEGFEKPLLHTVQRRGLHARGLSRYSAAQCRRPSESRCSRVARAAVRTSR